MSKESMGGAFLFTNLKKHIRGQRFATDDELNYATEEWLKG